MAELEAGIAQLKDALARRQQVGVATGLLAPRFADHTEWAWSLLVRVSQNGHAHRSGHDQRTAVDSAQQIRNTQRDRDAGPTVNGQRPPAKVRSDRGSTRPCA